MVEFFCHQGIISRKVFAHLILVSKVRSWSSFFVIRGSSVEKLFEIVVKFLCHQGIISRKVI